jgi:alpha-tubulin suppressor-like RCC1 family protein
MACDVAGAEGHCSPVPSGPPHGARTACAGAGSTCAGSCGGRQDGACQYPTGPCGASSCMGTDMYTPQGACGAGVCTPSSPMTCPNGLTCSGTMCKTSCATSADCRAGFYCASSSCRPLTATQVTCGQDFSCALLSDGSVKCWGDNSTGQLGNTAAGTASVTPVPVDGLTGVVKIDSGTGSTCALMPDSTVRCWGNGGYGLGDGTTGTNAPTPIVVRGLNDAVAIAVGRAYICAIRQTGAVMCWGHLQFVPDSPTPVAVAGVSGVTAIDVGSWSACAVSSGAVYCWGGNSRGELGLDPAATANSPSPLLVPGVAAYSVSAGLEFNCVVQGPFGASVECWGDQSGAFTGPFSFTPSVVNGINDAVAICTGVAHVCAITHARTVKCWGSNGYGQLGVDLSTSNLAAPTDAVSGVSNAVSLACGDFHTCAVTSDGAVHCWGYNPNGQLGSPPITTRPFGTNQLTTISQW